MVQKKSPCEKLQNQIVKQKLKLDLLENKMKEEMSKGHNVLPPPDIIKVQMSKQQVEFDFNEIKKQADEFLEECSKNPAKEPVKKRVINRKPKVKTI